MRISVDRDDPGFETLAILGERRRKGIKILLDGQVVKRAITADDDEGYVLAYAEDLDGGLASVDGEPIRKELHGRVRIIVPEVESAPIITPLDHAKGAYKLWSLDPDLSPERISEILGVSPLNLISIDGKSTYDWAFAVDGARVRHLGLSGQAVVCVRP